MPAPLATAASAPKTTKKKRRWIAWALLGAAIIAIVVLVGQLRGVTEGVRDAQQSLDDALLSDNQLEYLAETQTLGSCDVVRIRLGIALEVVANDGYLDDTYAGVTFGERLEETAEEQLDTLRCGG
ncbi:MAG: hypothetical protein ACC726_02325 [Chloroflexota bacterium]